MLQPLKMYPLPAIPTELPYHLEPGSFLRSAQQSPKPCHPHSIPERGHNDLFVGLCVPWFLRSQLDWGCHLAYQLGAGFLHPTGLDPNGCSGGLASDGASEP